MAQRNPYDLGWVAEQRQRHGGPPTNTYRLGYEAGVSDTLAKVRALPFIERLNSHRLGCWFCGTSWNDTDEPRHEDACLHLEAQRAHQELPHG